MRGPVNFGFQRVDLSDFWELKPNPLQAFALDPLDQVVLKSKPVEVDEGEAGVNGNGDGGGSVQSSGLTSLVRT